jgi:D-alanyl-D-alanine carboxypeptidase
MKYVLTIISLLCLAATCEKDKVFLQDFYTCKGEVTSNTSYDRAEACKALMADITGSGVPGIMMTVHDQVYGYWSAAEGMADLASGITLKPCNITRTGSTVKTFTAVSILLLQEDGLLNIDRPVTDYLQQQDIRGLRNADKATVRQLLQHSSGIFNYIQDPKFQAASLNDLVKDWRPEELLAYARGKDPYFAPGTNLRYSNTNYILLGMIIERVSGKPFYQFFKERIFDPYSLYFTQFAATDPVPDGIIRGYVDFYSNGNLTNATYFSGWDYYTADGGLISNSFDLNTFLTKLFDGQVLRDSSLQQMLSWKEPAEQEKDGFKTAYGLGIFRIETNHGPAYIHSGDAIGYMASMVYFPEQRVTITWAVNANYGKVDEFTQSKKAMEDIFDTVLK